MTRNLCDGCRMADTAKSLPAAWLDRVARVNAIVAAATDRRRALFERHVERLGDCWLYTPQTAHGYARVSIAGQQVMAHRCAKIWLSGLPPADLPIACHTCRNRNCVRPTHIVWGDWQSNAADQLRDGTKFSEKRGGDGHAMAKLNSALARSIYQEIAKGGVSASQVARRYQVTAAAVQEIVERRNWRRATSDLPPIALERFQRGMWARERHHSARLTSDAAKLIYTRAVAGESPTAIAAEHGISAAAVCDIRAGRSWAAVTLGRRNAR